MARTRKSICVFRIEPRRGPEVSDRDDRVRQGDGREGLLAEVVTWAQLGIHSKPCGLLNVKGYYDALLTYLDHAVGERFLRPEHRGIIQVAKSPEAMLDLLENYEPDHLGKWMDRDQT